MVRKRKEAEAESGGEGEKDTVQTGREVQVISEELRTQLTGLMQELLLKCHELSFEYSTSDCEELLKCPIAVKSKEVFKVVKKLNQLVRRMTPSYIS